jgi:hypothetical protein
MSVVFPLRVGRADEDITKGNIVFTHKSIPGNQFFEWMKVYEAGVIEQMTKLLGERTDIFRERYHSSITERSPYPVTMRAKWTEAKTYVFDKTVLGAPISVGLADAIDRGLLTRKTSAKFILEHVGVWGINRRYSNQWQVMQILITRYPDNPANFAFIEDSDE